jgi:DNA-binding response OmpR family regulator
MKIMMVEDDPIILRMYENLFMRLDIESMTAVDGALVLETIAYNRPDAIIMDVMMPNFNGLATLQDIKNDFRTQRIPVFMLSANDDEKIIKKALDLGAKRYLIKDQFEPQEVVDIIKTTIGKT